MTRRPVGANGTEDLRRMWMGPDKFLAIWL